MELLTVTVVGYKRFRFPNHLQTNGKLVALLGPNEAGKSSLLHAIAHLGHDDAVEIEEVSRGLSREDLVIKGRFFLSTSELEAAGLEGPRSMEVVKSGSGSRVMNFAPQVPSRDTSHRAQFVKQLSELSLHVTTREIIDGYDADFLPALEVLGSAIEGEGEKLKPATLDQLRARHEELKEAVSGQSASNIERLLETQRKLIALESAPTPLERALVEWLLVRALFFAAHDDGEGPPGLGFALIPQTLLLLGTLAVYYLGIAVAGAKAVWQTLSGR